MGSEARRLHGTLLALAGFVAACGDLGDASDSGGFIEGGFNPGGSYEGGAGFGGEGGMPTPPGPFNYTALCGIGIESCVPGENLSAGCSPEPNGGGAGVGGASEGGAGVGGAGQGGQSQGGAPGAGGEAGAPEGGAGGGGPLPGYSCQVADARGAPSSQCLPSGNTLINGVCNSSADCLPGLGCVLASEGETEGTGGGPEAPPVGLCRPYCCDELEDCPQDTFCAPEPMFDAGAQLEDPRSALPIPVCTPIHSCTLLGTTDCPEGETCSVVRADGATSCVPIGEGTLCQPCDCAAGFICIFGTGTCAQLCDTNASDCPGEGAICQGGGNFPDMVGVCVGGDATCTP
ncbi:MAG: hypothetical protein HOW73_36605 [Polyangiaceae bacterium]|nr:hypothetical protein [Polyangiaceae bacterium]